MKVKVVDEIMSSGKSHWMMNKIREWNSEGVFEQFVYLSPLLTEVGGEVCSDTNKRKKGRIQEHLPELEFKYPVPIKGSKSDNARDLLFQGKNLSATHSLFLGFDRSIVDTIEQYKNVLIIDECLDAYKVFDGISKKSLHSFITDRTFLVDKETNQLTYNHNEHPLSGSWEFTELANLCDTGCVFYANGDVVIWEFPASVLSAFDEVWVLTYLFKGSFMHAWCQIHNADIEYVHPVLNRTTAEVKAYIKDCITLMETRSMKEIEQYAYSQTWWQDQAVVGVVDKIKKCLESCVRTTGSKSDQILITCPLANWEHDKIGKSPKRTLVKGKGFSRSTWLFSDAKATNDYADKNTLIYLLGKNPNPMVYNFCHSKGIEINRDLFALASFLQWVFRGSVRKKEHMYLIVPSKRMRELFKIWIECDDELLEDKLNNK